MLVYASLEYPIGRKRYFHFLWKLGTFLWNGPFSTGEELYVRVEMANSKNIEEILIRILMRYKLFKKIKSLYHATHNINFQWNKL